MYLIVLGFLSLGAIRGGGILIISPTGEMMGLPLSSLKKMPFDSYLIPGIILFSVLGAIPLLLIIALLKKQNSTMQNTSASTEICTKRGRSAFILPLY